MATSSIEWTDATWNPVSGCTRVSAGCDNCYAVVMTRRLAKMGQAAKYGGLVNEGKRHFNGVVRTHEDALELPLSWKKPRRIFVNSMSDLFHRDVPFEFIDRVFAVAALTPRHTYQVLTKRPDRAAEYFAQLTPDRLIDVVAFDYGEEAWMFAGNWIDGWSQPREVPSDGNPLDGSVKRWPLPNVWIGTSVENQAAADERIPHLLSTPAAVRFLSCEPLLGPVDLRLYASGEVLPSDREPFAERADLLHWVIVGGESGPHARPMDVEWARGLLQQCRDAEVPCFVKQLGGHPDKRGDMAEWPEDLRVREMPVTDSARND
jgi:protein gp37